MTTLTAYDTAIQELYVAYFGRPADYFGLQNFETALLNANAPTDPSQLAGAYSSNSAIKTLVDAFGTSKESQALYGNINGSADVANAFVNAIFENMFGRAANAAGLHFWSNAITTGALTASDAALAIAAGAAANTSAQGVQDATTLANKVVVASDFTTQISQESSLVLEYSGPLAAGIGRTLLAGVTSSNLATYVSYVPIAVQALDPPDGGAHTLGTGADDYIDTQGHLRFFATLDNAAGLAAGGAAATLNPGDIIGCTVQPYIFNPIIDSLFIADFGLGADLAIPATASITGFNVLKMQSLEAVADPTAQNGSLDFSGWAGLVQIDVTASVGVDNITAPAAATINVTDSAGNVTVHGGTSVSVTTDAASIITIDGDTGTTGVTLVGGGSGSGNVITDQNFGTGHSNTIATVNLTLDGVATINSDALTSLSLIGPSNMVTVNAAAGARTLTVSTDGAFTGLTDNSATALNFTIAGSGTTALKLDAASATSITFNDDANVLVTHLAAPLATAVSIDGAGSFSGFLPQGANSLHVDASASTGALNIVFDKGMAVLLAGGSGAATIVATGADTIDMAFGSAGNSFSSGAGVTGTLHFAAHAGGQSLTLGALAVAGSTPALTPDLTHILAISGLNNAGQDTIAFADAAQTNGTSFQQVSAAQVAAAGASATSLSGWIATATGLGGVVQQSAHGVLEFQFGGNTYLIETASANDAGTIDARDAIVELVGSSYTFAHVSTINGGMLHL
jgi:S-layer protein